MALDGSFLKQLKHELEEQILDAKVDKVHQISREELILILRSRNGNCKLYISAGADSPRIHLTTTSFENPKTPPMFCMLMRKHLIGARIIGLEQVGLDRILKIIFETRNEMGDIVQISGIIEIMGRHSNFIVVDQDGRIIDSMKRVDDTMSSVRPVLPGMRYVLPPAQDKLLLTETSAETMVDTILHGKDVPLSKAILNAVQGVSPLVCREIANYVFFGDDNVVSAMSSDHIDRLRFYLGRVKDMVVNHIGTPTAIINAKGKPQDFSFLDIHQYGPSMVTRQYETYSQLLDQFYTQRDHVQRMKHRSADLLKFLANTSDRIARKVNLQKQELEESAQREQWKMYGDILSANLWSIQKGDKEATLQNFYEEGMPMVTIPLDVRKTPSQNAQKYYAEYRKADTAEKKLLELIEQGEQEYLYIDSVFDALTRAATIDELAGIRSELESQGYLRAQNRKGMKPQKLNPKKYVSDDGFTILVGRNNIQNDQLTLKESNGRDMWFHTKNIPGSHCIVISEGQEIPDSTLTQAAILAATNSRAVESSQVPVDYTQIKHIKKPKGGKPGMVIYHVYNTAYVTPDPELEKRLRVE